MKTSLYVLCFVLYAATACAGEETILIIESYHQEYSWDASYRKGIQDVFGEQYTLEFFEMDTKRLPVAQHQKQADAAWNLYETLQPVLVMLGDDNALKFLGARFAETSTPVVYLGINANPRTYIPAKADNITGVLERPLLGHSVRTIKKLLPEVKNLLVLFDSGTTAHVVLEEAFEGKSDFLIYGVTVHIRLIEQWEDWQQTVLQAAQDYDALVAGLYQTIIDRKNQHVTDTDVIQWTSENTPIPPFCFWDFAVGHDKTIGGLVLYGQEQGELAAEIALDILEGGKIPKSIFPMTTRKGRLLFSKTQLRKHKIRLPADIAEKADFID